MLGGSSRPPTSWRRFTTAGAATCGSSTASCSPTTGRRSSGRCAARAGAPIGAPTDRLYGTWIPVRLRALPATSARYVERPRLPDAQRSGWSAKQESTDERGRAADPARGRRRAGVRRDTVRPHRAIRTAHACRSLLRTDVECCEFSQYMIVRSDQGGRRQVRIGEVAMGPTSTRIYAGADPRRHVREVDTPG